MNNEFIVADILFFINYVFGKLALLFLNKTFVFWLKTFESKFFDKIGRFETLFRENLRFSNFAINWSCSMTHAISQN